MLRRPSEVINWFKTQQAQVLQQATVKAANAMAANAPSRVSNNASINTTMSTHPEIIPQIIPRKSRFSSALPYHSGDANNPSYM